jgi:D-sedoheptulose 7-phosphate isomerase
MQRSWKKGKRSSKKESQQQLHKTKLLFSSEDIIRTHLQEAQVALERFLSDSNNFAQIDRAGELMAEAVLKGGKIISCGNGGSMCDAMHFAEELSGRFRDERRALPAIAISDPAHITCTANDHGYEYIFSRFIEAFGKPGDVLLAISTSGNSGNVLLAAEAAKNAGMMVVALTGKDGGKLSVLADVEIRAPYARYSDRVQEIHIKVIHILIHLIETRLGLCK